MIPDAERAMTEGDAAAERVIARRLEAAWHYRITKRPGDDAVDFNLASLATGKLVAVAELKDRDCRMGDYPNIWVAETKAQALLHLQTTLGVVGLFVIRARREDRLYVARAARLLMAPCAERRRVKPRATGLRLAQDVEVMRLVPVAYWQRVHEPRTGSAW